MDEDKTDQTVDTADNLREAEENSLYTPSASGGESVSEDASLYARPSSANRGSKGRGFVWGSPRRAAIGGGILATLTGGIVFFTTLAGPLQFVHIDQTMQQAHFAAQADAQDNRFAKQVRFANYAYRAATGEIEKTRLGILGNHFANQFESKLNTSGFKSAYSDKFGLFDGYVIDKNNPEFKDLGSDEKIKSYVKETYGVDVVDGSTISRSKLNGELVVDASKLGFFKTLSLNNKMLSSAGYKKLPSAIGARLMCQRAGCTLHPLKKLSAKGQSAIEEWWKNRNQSVKEGAGAVEVVDKNGTKQNDPNKKTTDGVDQSISDTEASAQTGDPEKVRVSTKAKLLGGPSAIIGVFCIVRGINSDAAAIKQAQVIFPLIRMGIEIIAVGDQIKSGQQVDPDELAKYNSMLSGVGPDGKQTSWLQAESVQAEMGGSLNGTIPPDGTLKSINGGEPFGFVNSIPGLKQACSPIGSILTGGVTLLLDATGIGALAQQTLSGLALQVAQGPILDQISHWLAGNAVDTTPVGAQYGNYFNYGAALAANDQAIGSGGTALSPKAVFELKTGETIASNKEFGQKSLLSRLFDAKDSRSTIAKLIDNTSPSPKQNFASLGSFLLDFPKHFTSIAKLFSPHVQAASNYDYGFPTMGLSPEDLDNPLVENPYENASAAADVLNSPAGPGYIQRAKDCFGDILSQDDKGTWSVTTTGQSVNYTTDAYKKLADSCADHSDSWVRIRMFITDSLTMDGPACYEGDDQACTDIGFGTPDLSQTDTGSASGGGANIAASQAPEIAKQILANKNIALAGFSQQDIQLAADNKPGTAGAKTSAAILNLILEVGKRHRVAVTAIQSGGMGHCDGKPKSLCPDDPHYTGDAVDFGAIEASQLTGRDKYSIEIINLAEQLLPTGSGFGQTEDPKVHTACGPQITLKPGFEQFADTCDHLHVQVPKGTP